MANEPLINLRVLTGYDKDYGVFVSKCLETGDVTTGDTSEGASALLKDLLACSLNSEQQSIRNLFSCPAKIAWWIAWVEYGVPSGEYRIALTRWPGEIAARCRVVPEGLHVPPE